MIRLNPYEILSHIIPGFIIYVVVEYFFPGVLPKVDVLPSLAIGFFFGYFVNILSAYLEHFYFWTWGGKPSNQLLEGKKIWKVNFYEQSRALKLLKEDYGNEEAPTEALFGVAWRVANNSGNDRVGEFNSSYAVSRGILTCAILIVGLLVYRYPGHWQSYLGGALLLWASWLRAKQRAAYYAREILSTYLTEKSKSTAHQAD